MAKKSGARKGASKRAGKITRTARKTGSYKGGRGGAKKSRAEIVSRTQPVPPRKRK